MTINIRDSFGEFFPDTEHYAELQDDRYSKMIDGERKYIRFNVIDVRPNLTKKRFYYHLVGGDHMSVEFKGFEEVYKNLQKQLSEQALGRVSSKALTAGAHVVAATISQEFEKFKDTGPPRKKLS
ncbi:hypothetical protein RCO48_04565 [Peribacillus frigoritolerans]|nr:hypothetical protein [Peribacillus frigoritolerans]